MYQGLVAFGCQLLQKPANMPLTLTDFLRGSPLRDHSLFGFLQGDQPVAVSLRHEKCSCIHLLSPILSIGHFYLAQLGQYHLAATAAAMRLRRAAAFVLMVTDEIRPPPIPK